MNKLLLLVTLLFVANMASAQSVTLPNGIEYRIVKKGKGTKTAKVSNFISIILKGTCSGQTLFDTKQINKGVNSPVNFPVQKKTI
jgi:FKBP-type peptidyl-prolyl cis-trans isomerase